MEIVGLSRKRTVSIDSNEIDMEQVHKRRRDKVYKQAQHKKNQRRNGSNGRGEINGRGKR